MSNPKEPPLPGTAEKSNCHAVLRGPMIPALTHYNRDLSLDLTALKVNLDYLIERGIRTASGVLLIAGAGGDFPMLTLEERRTLIETAVEAVGGRCPVVAGAQSNNLREVLELARVADDAGAYAVQVSPPYYYMPASEDVLHWFRTVNAAVRKTGIMVYNTWWKGFNLSFDTLDEVIAFDRVVSLKWSAPSDLEFQQGLTRYASRVAVVDNALMWPLSAMLGATGFITHLGTVWPEYVVSLDGLLKAGRYREAMDSMREKKWPWMQFRLAMEKYTGGEAPPVRAALELCGRPGGPCRPPSRDLDNEQRRELRALLKHIGVPPA